MEGLFAGQIYGSDAVVINKVDLVEASVVDTVEREVRDYDADTQIFRVSALDPVNGEVWKGVLGI